MQNLAYKLKATPKVVLPTLASTSELNAKGNPDRCPACGHELFGADAEACSWQAWGTFWEILGLSNVELVSSGCGEYLQDYFATNCK